METQFTNRLLVIQKASRTALIVGGIIVAIIVSPFLMRDIDVHANFSILPHVGTSTNQIVQQATSLSVDRFRTLITAAVN
ncbi:MAG: hypothetical protein ABIS36_12110 [Chryseolinea sp.]